jgi:hypothetical protein
MEFSGVGECGVVYRPILFLAPCFHTLCGTTSLKFTENIKKVTLQPLPKQFPLSPLFNPRSTPLNIIAGSVTDPRLPPRGLKSLN